MVKVRINPEPRVPRPIVGRILRIEEYVPYNRYDTTPPKGLVVVHETNPSFIKFLEEQDGRFQERVAKPQSRLASVPKKEADELRKKWLERLAVCPIGSCTPQALAGTWRSGSDPELFAVSGNGHVIPAWNFLPSKKEPVEELTHPNDARIRKVFWDGFQAEFTVPEGTCHAYMMDSIRNGIKTIYDKAKALDKGASVTHKCVVDLDPELLLASPPECVALGCDPSSNAYTDGQNPLLAEVDPITLSFRFAGFHIHFGCGKLTDKQYVRIVKLLDAIVGVFSVCLLEGLEDDRRRRYYGLAGEYRTPAHGLEYRTLSSACLVHPAITHLILDMSRQVANLAHRGWSYLWQADENEVREAINTLNVELAKRIVKQNEKALKALFASFSGYGNKPMRLIERGARNLIPTDMRQNWKLNDYWSRHSDDNRATMANLVLN
jgi:hypothetical protein